MVKQNYGEINEENIEELKAFSARFKLSTLDSFKQVCKRTEQTVHKGN